MKQNGSLNNYKEVFNGKEVGLIIEVAVPKEPHSKVMKTSIGDYLQFGKPIGEVDGKQMFFNTFIHGDDKTDLGRLHGKKVVGYPIVMEKQMPDGRTFLHLDVYLAKHNARPSHQVLTRVADTPPSSAWWQSKARKPAPASTDIVLSLPLPAPTNGFVAIVSL